MLLVAFCPKKERNKMNARIRSRPNLICLTPHLLKRRAAIIWAAHIGTHVFLKLHDNYQTKNKCSYDNRQKKCFISLGFVIVIASKWETFPSDWIWICVRTVSNFHGTEIGIWAGFGPVGSTEKKLANFEQVLRVAFSCFIGQKQIFKFL